MCVTWFTIATGGNSEWNPTSAFNHSRDSIELNSWTARFFVNECRKSLSLNPNTEGGFHLSSCLFTDNNRFGDMETESRALIYHYTPQYTGDKGVFTQMYIFPVSP